MSVALVILSNNMSVALVIFLKSKYKNIINKIKTKKITKLNIKP